MLGPKASGQLEAGSSVFLSSADLDLGVPMEFQQGSQVYLEWIGTLGSFGMVARPLEFLSVSS